MWPLFLQYFYDFGVENIINGKLFGNPAWCALRGKGREPGSAESYYGAADAHRIDSKCGGMLNDPSNSAYEIGFDFGQIFSFKNHSSGLLCIRSVFRGKGCPVAHAADDHSDFLPGAWTFLSLTEEGGSFVCPF